mmetsp:Transcript_35839/g.37223  ORF Transcript_35839/g.37223 Transcript_35839/m.37223 type:complete len:137 (-) Transcript_35839:53-463(-)
MIGYLREFNRQLSENLYLSDIRNSLLTEQEDCLKQTRDNDLNKEAEIGCYEKLLSFEDEIQTMKKKAFLESYELCLVKSRYKKTRIISVGLYDHEFSDNLDYHMVDKCIGELVFNQMDTAQEQISERIRLSSKLLV